MKKIIIPSIVVTLALVAYGGLSLRDQLTQPTTQSRAESSSQTVKTPTDPNLHDYDDVDFARKKLVHHQLAVLIADKAKTDATRPEIRELATTISARETERANLYVALLDSWDETYFNITDFPEVNGCHSYPTFNGMLSVDAVGKYRLSSGEEVDRGFAELMVAHHEKAEDLANYEGGLVGHKKLIDLREASIKQYQAELLPLQSLQL